MNNVDLGRYSKKIVQYLWDPEPVNDGTDASPIWCLGKQYDSSKTYDVNKASEYAETINSAPVEIKNPADSVSSLPPDDQYTASSEDSADPELSHRETSFEEVSKSDLHQMSQESNLCSWPEAFLDDFESRIWLTYRSGFPPIPKSSDPKATSNMSLAVRLKSMAAHEGFTSDSGWGCMIRSGQCLLANAIAMLRLGRDRRRGDRNAQEKEILRLFADDPAAPFSIHSFVKHGAEVCGTFPGQWFGPSATARCIRDLITRHPEIGIRAYITGNGPDVFEETMFSIARAEGGIFRPTLLLVGTRLGIDQVTPAYWNALKSALKLPQSVGIAGGRPSSSHYFVGLQGSHFFYLDPHFTRPALPLHSEPADYTDDELNSCHTRRLRRISIKEMDPSMLIAFLIRDESDWREWRRCMEQVKSKGIVHVSDTEPGSNGSSSERDEALDEVQTIDDDEVNELNEDDSGEPVHVERM